MHSPPRVALFTRYPRPGQAKTRLIPALGPERAAVLHRKLTERTLAVLASSTFSFDVRTTGGSLSEFHAWLGDVPLVDQGDGDLGARLARATRPAPVILIGADTPDLQLHHLQDAATALTRSPAVIGPAEDGGYYLLGLSRECDWLFDNMPWGTDMVLPVTLQRLSERAITPVMLEALADLDRPEDLVRWPHLTS